MSIIKNGLIIASIVLFEPLGLLFAWLWRREWFKRIGATSAMILWSVLYVIAMVTPSDEPQMTTSAVDVSDVDEANNEDVTVVDDVELNEGADEPEPEVPDVKEDGIAVPVASGSNNEPEHVPTPVTQSQTTTPNTSAGSANSFSNAAGDNPTGECVIKGNVNSKGEKIYHTPQSRSYSKTKVNAAEGDRWFCTVQEAIDAGFRAPLN